MSFRHWKILVSICFMMLFLVGWAGSSGPVVQESESSISLLTLPAPALSVQVPQSVFESVAYTSVSRRSEVTQAIEESLTPGEEQFTLTRDSRLLFLGNSLISGIKSNSGRAGRQDSFICKVGISLKEFNSKYPAKASNCDFDAVVVEMGSNELGVYSEEQFLEEYTKLIDYFNCPVFCLSIPPVNEAKSHYAKRVCNRNVLLYNGFVERVCEETGAVYVDCSEFFGDVLDSAWTGDGLHLKSGVYAQWYVWLLNQILN